MPRGLPPPSVVFRTFGAFPRTAILFLFHCDSYRLAWFYFSRLDGFAVLFYPDGQFAAAGTLDVDVEGRVGAGMDADEAVFVPFRRHLRGEGEAVEACGTEAQQAFRDDAAKESALG